MTLDSETTNPHSSSHTEHPFPLPLPLCPHFPACRDEFSASKTPSAKFSSPWQCDALIAIYLCRTHSGLSLPSADPRAPLPECPPSIIVAECCLLARPPNIFP